MRSVEIQCSHSQRYLMKLGVCERNFGAKPEFAVDSEAIILEAQNFNVMIELIPKSKATCQPCELARRRLVQ